eukprot:6196945-Pleurochrysis_carterae.AAC.2
MMMTNSIEGVRSSTTSEVQSSGATFLPVETDLAMQIKPNLIFTLLDDVGAGDLGYTSSDIRSPNMDKLAKEGIRLGRHYTYM